MSYVLVGLLVAVLLWGTGARRVLSRNRWRVTSGAFSVGVLAAAGFVAVRGGWIEGLLLGAVGLLLAASTRWPRATPAAPGPPPEAMSLEQARATLGVGPGASVDEIKAAYTRLMRRVHPDHGGASGLAAQLNVARDRLLKR